MTDHLPQRQPRRSSALRRLAVTAPLVAGLVAPALPAAAAPAPAPVPVVLTGEPGASAAVRAAVRAVGGTVSRALPLVDGVSALVPPSALARLRTAPGVRSAQHDGALVPLDSAWGDDTTGETAAATLDDGTWQADHDQGSAFAITKATGAQDVWSQSDRYVADRKITGHGVGIAVLDTGVTPVEGLSTPGKLVHGPDLSLDNGVEGLRHLDGYGHGTHMASLAAGRDSTLPQGGEADRKHFAGMAPSAHVVNVKVGAGDGAVDVSQVIAGLDWVVQHRAETGTRVVSLSYGTDSTQAPRLDPLAHAVENAWRAGLVVVVSAGNGGREGATSLTMPAIDPWVIAVGSLDHMGTDTPDDDRVGDWTNHGTDARRPDLVAPGKSVVGLRVPGSHADRLHPEARLASAPGDRLFRGTGTSQSAAVVAGAAALLLQAEPSLTPDQVKGVLRATADPLKSDSSPTQGAGRLDVKGAYELVKDGTHGAYAQSWETSTGLGSLQASRGGADDLVDPATGVALDGEVDAIGEPWAAGAWAAASTAGTAWSGGTWNGRHWSGDGWGDESLTVGGFAGRHWSGRHWSGRHWSGRHWSSEDWDGRHWSGRHWSGRHWSGLGWSDGTTTG